MLSRSRRRFLACAAVCTFVTTAVLAALLSRAALSGPSLSATPTSGPDPDPLKHEETPEKSSIQADKPSDWCGLHSVETKGSFVKPYMNILEMIGEGDADFQMEHCVPVQRFHFVKMFKSASSTMATLLLRYADLRRLNVELPIRNKFFFEEPSKCSDDSYMGGFASMPPYDVRVAHGVFHVEWSRKFLPGRKAITAVRDPITRFVSAWGFFNGNKKFGYPADMPIEEAIKDFLNTPEQLSKMPHFHKFTNDVVVQLGRQSECESDARDVDTIVDLIENEFAFVLVTDRMEESLVLLQHEMCWSLSDVVYVARKLLGTGETANSFLNEKEKETILKLADEDKVVYDTAVRLFEERLAALPGCDEDMCGNVPMCVSEHAALIRRLTDKLAATCEGWEDNVVELGQELFDMCELLSFDTDLYAGYLHERYKKKRPSIREVVGDGWPEYVRDPVFDPAPTLELEE